MSKGQIVARGLRIAAVAVPVLALAALWYFADLSSYRSAEQLAQAVRGIADQRFGFFIVPFGFALGTLLFIPLTALIAGTTLAFEPWQGLVFSMTGALLGASLSYGVGLLLGGSAVDKLTGPRLLKIRGHARRHPFRTTLIVRLLPIGSFTASNVLAGSLRMPFGGFLAGAAVGLLPGIVFLTFLARQLPQAIRAPTPLNLLLLVGGVVVLAALAWVVRRWAKRAERQSLAEQPNV